MSGFSSFGYVVLAIDSAYNKAHGHCEECSDEAISWKFRPVY